MFDPYYAIWLREQMLEARNTEVQLARGEGFMVRRQTLYIWFVVAFVMMFGGFLMIAMQPVGELATPLTLWGIALSICGLFVLLIPFVQYIVSTPTRCARCGEMLLPRDVMAFRRLCERCLKETRVL